MIFSLAACNLSDIEKENAPDISTEATEDIVDIHAGARAVLEEIVKNHVADENFIDVVLNNVPDAFTIVGYRAACWTYFLETSDGLEYMVIIDYNGTVTSISYWDPELQETGMEYYIWSK
jgi:hypothetical protein